MSLIDNESTNKVDFEWSDQLNTQLNDALQSADRFIKYKNKLTSAISFDKALYGLSNHKLSLNDHSDLEYLITRYTEDKIR